MGLKRPLWDGLNQPREHGGYVCLLHWRDWDAFRPCHNRSCFGFHSLCVSWLTGANRNPAGEKEFGVVRELWVWVFLAGGSRQDIQEEPRSTAQGKSWLLDEEVEKEEAGRG